MKRNDGGAAFPRPDVVTPSESLWEVGTPGMTLRDYFAAMTAPAIWTELSINLRANSQCVDSTYEIAAIAAYQMADALLAARSAE